MKGRKEEGEEETKGGEVSHSVTPFSPKAKEEKKKGN